MVVRLARSKGPPLERKGKTKQRRTKLGREQRSEEKEEEEREKRGAARLEKERREGTKMDGEFAIVTQRRC